MNATLKRVNQATTAFFRWICDTRQDGALVSKAWSDTQDRTRQQGFELGDTYLMVREVLAGQLERLNRRPGKLINYRVVAEALLMKAGKWEPRKKEPEWANWLQTPENLVMPRYQRIGRRQGGFRSRQTIRLK